MTQTILQMQASSFASLNSEILLAIGVISFAISMTVCVSLWIGQILKSTPAGVIGGTGVFSVLYFGTDQLNIELLVASPIAVGITGVAILAASVIANMRVSTAEL